MRGPVPRTRAVMTRIVGIAVRRPWFVLTNVNGVRVHAPTKGPVTRARAVMTRLVGVVVRRPWFVLTNVNGVRVRVAARAVRRGILTRRVAGVVARKL